MAGNPYIAVLCDKCGASALRREDQVKARGGTWRCRSCGKRGAENPMYGRPNPKSAEYNTKHGGYYTRSYTSWRKMKDRVCNPNHVHFKHYGGRGITVCEKWLKFEGFYEDMGDRPEGYSLERVDVNGNYEKDNCTWIPLVDQPKNRRCVVT